MNDGQLIANLRSHSGEGSDTERGIRRLAVSSDDGETWPSVRPDLLPRTALAVIRLGAYTGTKAKREQYAAQVGFTRLFNALAAARTPLIGHNMLYDLLFMMAKFGLTSLTLMSGLVSMAQA